jgi:hypothetical protein
MKKPIIGTAALIAALNLSGCMLVMAGGDYHGDQGDLVSRDGTIRYVGWCDVHPHNAHCLSGPDANTAALSPVTVGATSITTVDRTTYRIGATLNSGKSPPDIADIN